MSGPTSGYSAPADLVGVALEIRSAAGGADAAAFAATLAEAYTRYAARRGWRCELVEAQPGPSGAGYRLVVLRLPAQAWSSLAGEAGTHRVTHPVAARRGERWHTSAATVAVLPARRSDPGALRPDQLRAETFRASGPGGQHRNKTDSAVRLTHLPSGLTATAAGDRSQHRNRAEALALLTARLADEAEAARTGAERDRRRAQVGSGEAAERIRTWSHRERQVIDHRSGARLSIERAVAGDLDPLLLN